jgi:SAM-dependent methyltransferase
MSSTVPYDNVADLYDVWVANMPLVAEASRRFYLREYLATNGPIAELGVGNGRILIGAAKAGKPVIGVDSSSKMIALCRHRALEAQVSEQLQLIQADFRDFRLPCAARLITIPYDSLGHLVSREAISVCLENIYSQLESGGRFIFDMQVYSPERFVERDRRPYLYTTFRDRQTGRETLLWLVTIHDLARQSRRSLLWTEEIEENGILGPRKVRCIENSCFLPAQLERLLKHTGFVVDAIYGDFDGPLTDKSEYQVFVAHRN